MTARSGWLLKFIVGHGCQFTYTCLQYSQTGECNFPRDHSKNPGLYFMLGRISQRQCDVFARDMLLSTDGSFTLCVSQHWIYLSRTTASFLALRGLCVLFTQSVCCWRLPRDCCAFNAYCQFSSHPSAYYSCHLNHSCCHKPHDPEQTPEHLFLQPKLIRLRESVMGKFGCVLQSSW